LNIISGVNLNYNRIIGCQVFDKTALIAAVIIILKNWSDND